MVEQEKIPYTLENKVIREVINKIVKSWLAKYGQD